MSKASIKADVTKKVNELTAAAEFLVSQGCENVAADGRSTVRFVTPAGDNGSATRHRGGAWTEVIGEETHEHRSLAALKRAWRDGEAETGPELFNVIGNVYLTADSIATFRAYAEDAPNWGGNPYVSNGNITCTKEMRGNLTDLVKKGLIRICSFDLGQYIEFTAEGKAAAASLGISLS